MWSQSTSGQEQTTSSSSQQVTGSSSTAFTEDEVLAELQQLGYTLNREQVVQLQREINQLLMQQTSSTSSSDPSKSYSNFAALPQYPPQLTTGYHGQQQPASSGQQQPASSGQQPGASASYKQSGTHQSFPTTNTTTSSQPHGHFQIPAELRDQVDPDVADLLNQAYQLSAMLRHDTRRIDQILTVNEHNKHKTAYPEDGKENSAPGEQQPNHPDVTMTSGNGHDALEQSLIDAYDEVRRQYMDDPLAQPWIRPLVNAPIGGAAFKHDPVNRHEMYQKEWAKFPLLKQDKRLALRWKVREYMLRQDVPVMMLNQ